MSEAGSPLERFMFDLSCADEAKEEVDERMQQLHTQICKIIDKMKVDDTPILLPIFNITHERKDLEKLARALNRAAPLLEEFEKLGKRKAVLDIAKDDPGWLASTFGDFSGTFDKFEAEGGVAGWVEGIEDQEEEE